MPCHNLSEGCTVAPRFLQYLGTLESISSLQAVMRRKAARRPRPLFTAVDALEIFEALLPQEVQRLQRAHAGFAVQIVLLVRIEFGEALFDLA